MAPSLLEMMYQEWMIPGIHPKIHSRMLIQKSAAHPRLKNTGKGGMIIAKKYSKTSLVGETPLVIVGREVRKCVRVV